MISHDIERIAQNGELIIAGDIDMFAEVAVRDALGRILLGHEWRQLVADLSGGDE
jgi:hypothetical protein